MATVIAALCCAALLVAPSGATGVPAPEGDEPPRQTEPARAVDAAGTEIIDGIRVHGNSVTPEADVLALAGLAPGTPFEPPMLETVRRRLLDSGRFQDVEVLKRFASIADPFRILVVIIVNEHPVRFVPGAAPGEPPRALRREWWRQVMVLPLVYAEEGHPVTYGARLTWPRVAGRQSRLSSPLTWGGTREAGVLLERTFDVGPVSRVQAGGSIVRRRNPFYAEDDDRRRVWARAEHSAGPVRIGSTVARERVSFAEHDDRLTSVGADLLVDTRIDPVLSRRAIHLLASWERVMLSGQPAIHRTRLDLRGYLGLVGQSVLVARVARAAASRPQRPYLAFLAGGGSNLRGYRAGALAGDTLVGGSLEVRVPFSATLRRAKTGVSVFVDSAAAYAHGTPFRTGSVRTGAGAGVWLSLPVFRVELAVGRGDATRVHLNAGLGF